MCREDWNSNYINTKQLKQLIDTADISFLYDPDDPVPRRMFYKDINNPMRRIKRLIRKYLG